jgi:autotransporter-associated beta strand protein
LNGTVGTAGHVDFFSPVAAMRFTPFLLLLGLASIASAQSVSFTFSASQTAPISPYIYGINTTSLGNYTNATFYRTGGNRITAYNWTNNYSNAGSDYLFENDNFYTSSTAAGAGMADAIAPALNSNAGIAVAVPINGYVSKDGLGGNADVRYYPGTSTFDPNWLADRFVPEMPSKSLAGAGAFTLTPSPSSSVVYQDEFVNWVKTEYPAGFTTNSTTPIWFQLDNEPDLWASTHAELRPIVPGSVSASYPVGIPQPVTYAELVSKSIAYATAIKAVAPNAKVFGPVSYGWYGYTTLQGAPDSGADGDFLTYYLNQTAKASQAAGTRLIDALDLHWYTEVTATAANIPITNPDSGYSGGTLAAIQAARVQAPRSLWDPAYVENSWITVDSTNGQAIQLLPREKAKIAATAAAYGSQFTARQISISEYNYGGGDDITGGIAEADALGIFGQQGVLSANEWQLNSNESFIGGAFLMYRNYDGKGGTFGDISVGAASSSVSGASIYASDYSTNSARMTLVTINKTTGSVTAQMSLPNAPDGEPFTEAAIYDLTAASSTPQFVENLAIANAASFSYTMPGYSVTTIALSAAAPPAWSAAVSGSWSAAGNWTGGVPNAAGAIAVIDASTTTALTITLDKPQTLGALLLGNSAGSALGYTLSGTGSNSLTLNNSGYGATITVTGGTHAVNAPVILADNLQVAGGNNGWTLSIGGSISGSHSLTVSGNGTLLLSGQNTYTGGTTLAAGVLSLGAAENGTSGPLGESGAIVFNGGLLQYSAVNQHDYSSRFSTAANQVYSVDTNGQKVTWGAALNGFGNSLTKAGSGTLTLTSPGNDLVAANVYGGGVTLSGGTIGAFNLNTGAGSITIGAGATVSTLNLNAGGVTLSGGTIAAFNLNTAAGTIAIGAGATLATFNVNVGGITLNNGAIAAFNHNMGAGTSTIGAGETVAAINVNADTVNFSSTQTNGTLALPAGSTGTVIVGAASGGRWPMVATADFSNAPATGTVNAAHPLAITGTLKLPNGTTASLAGGTSFTAAGANLASILTPSTLGLGGGTLKIAVPSTPQSIAVHWSDYGGSGYSGITGTDGLVPQSNWTNVSAGWYTGGASSLVNNSGSATTAAVTSTLPSTAGTYWDVLGPTAGVDNLLCGPGGGKGGENGGAIGAIPNAITGIPYSSYEIIGYLNSYQSDSGEYSVWLDGNPASPNPSNGPLAGSRYYYSPTWTNPTGFVLMTNHTNTSTYNAGNTVVWTGLSGSRQVLWTEGWSASGRNDGNSNEGFTGFQIVDTATVPANVNLPQTAISVTSASTLDFGETGTPSLYHALGGLSLTAGTAGGTRLQFQNGLNIDFNGISATYPTGGSGAMTAVIMGGSNSPVISLAASSSVSAGPNVTLIIESTIGNPQTGATTLIKTGAGTLILSGSNSYTGGTIVEAGDLIVDSSTALRGGSSLFVGQQASSLFAPSIAEASGGETAVPEPETLMLLIAGLVAGLGVWRRRIYSVVGFDFRRGPRGVPVVPSPVHDAFFLPFRLLQRHLGSGAIGDLDRAASPHGLVGVVHREQEEGADAIREE